MSSPVGQLSLNGNAGPYREIVNSDHQNGDNTICVETKIREMIKRKQNEFGGNFDLPFFLGDLSKVERQYKQWKYLLPRVELFYAMKCCGEEPVLKLLAEMGACFDCASQKEIETILKLGVDPSRIIFAHTIKTVSSLQFASDNNVSLMTFDNEEELEKVKKYYPEARLVFRLRCKVSSHVDLNFGLMFGCPFENAERLLNKAKSLQMNVVGVCFHVGSGVTDPTVYEEAIRQSHDIFQTGRRVGFNFSLLDIGGGFLGNDASAFTKTAEGLNSSLESYFPLSTGVRIIAEPGRYMVTPAFTWVVQVIGKRPNENLGKGVVYSEGGIGPKTVCPRYIYYVNDGRYGAGRSNTLVMDEPKALACINKEADTSVTYSSLVYGPTCAPYDVLYEDIPLPELYIGDWLYMENAGAYSMVLATDFNMMPRAQCYYITDEMST